MLETVGFTDFPSVFDAVAKGTIDFGLVPVENTVSGTIREVSFRKSPPFCPPATLLVMSCGALGL